jgi:hypothetical protein
MSGTAEKPQGPAVLLVRGTGFWSILIRWITRSCWSHAALMTREGTVIDSRPGKGVSEHEDPMDWSLVDVFDPVGITDKQWDAVIAAARADVGFIHYDYWGDAKFLVGLDDDSRKKFCSEGLADWFATGGFPLLVRTQPWKVSPAHLGMSPRLDQRKRKEQTT